MGDYHTHYINGKVEYSFKLGVCDDYRYVRREEVERIRHEDAGEGANIPFVLAPESNVLFRFPWSCEDNDGESAIGHRNMFRTTYVNIPDMRQAIQSNVVHKDICHCVRPGMTKGGGYHFNVFYPCPMSLLFSVTENLRTSQSSGTPYPVISIYGVRYDEAGNERTIFRCGYCEAPFSLTEDEFPLVRQALIDHKMAPIAERIHPALKGAVKCQPS